MVKRFLACKVLGVAVFLGIMALVFHLTFNVAGDYLRKLLLRGIGAASASVNHLLELWDAPALLRSLIMEGIFPGVGTVLSFVPVIGLLFFFLSLMEESGYLSYIAALMDKPMRRIGLTGRAVVPLISGFGCNVPAIMTAGTLLKGSEKSAVIAMMPFMSCSARLPIYAMFIAVFFEAHRLLVLAAVYLTGIAMAILMALLIKKCSDDDRFRDGSASHCSGSARNSRYVNSSKTSASHRFDFPFICRLFRTTLHTVWQNCAGFVKKACTIILLASVIIWFLRTFGTGLQPVSNINDSLIATLGKAASPVFEPLGFSDWRASSAIISGLFAKETIISTLAMLSTSGSSSAVYAAVFSGGSSTLLTEAFTPLSAFSFMTFCLLYVPCVPTLAAVRQETGSIRFCIALIIIQLITAWTVSLLLFQAGNLL